MFFGITDIYTYLIGTLLIILLPGPNSLYVMSTASRYGRSKGYQAILGVLSGDTVLIALTIIGAGALLKAIPALFLILKAVGALYLGYIAIQLLMAAYKTWQNRHASSDGINVDSHLDHHPFKRAMTISLLNPKAILFFLSFFIQFVDPSYPYPALSFLILAVLLQLMSFLYLLSLVLMGSSMATFFKDRVMLAMIGFCSVAGLFIAFATKLLFTTL